MERLCIEFDDDRTMEISVDSSNSIYFILNCDDYTDSMTCGELFNALSNSIDIQNEKARKLLIAWQQRAAALDTELKELRSEHTKLRGEHEHLKKAIRIVNEEG